MKRLWHSYKKKFFWLIPAKVEEQVRLKAKAMGGWESPKWQGRQPGYGFWDKADAERFERLHRHEIKRPKARVTK